MKPWTNPSRWPSWTASDTSARATATVRPLIFRTSPARAPIRSRSAGARRAIACAMSSTRASATRSVTVAATDDVAGSLIGSPGKFRLQLVAEPFEHARELLPRDRFLRRRAGAIGLAGNHRDARRVAGGGERDRADVGVLDRPAIDSHRRHRHADHRLGALPRHDDRGDAALAVR